VSEASSDRVTPNEPDKVVVHGQGGAGGLTPAPFLVKVDRYGSVSALVEVEVPLGFIVIVDRMRQGRSVLP